MMVNHPAMILTDESNAFAHDTLKRRMPANIREVALLNPDYPPSILEALEQLARELEQNCPIGSFDPFLPDADVWEKAIEAHQGHSWQHTDWFFAEIAAYRQLISTVRWWETNRDPFAPKKSAEMSSQGLWTLLETALTARGEPLNERLYELIQLDLWGNRIDLSFAASLAHGNTGTLDDLLVNDTQAVVDHLLTQTRPIHFIADNTGTELAMDLTLADTLLDKGHERITFHVKLHPTFVSDTIVPDIHIMLAAMQSAERSEAVKQLGQRLQSALDTGRLRIAPGAFWNSPYLMRQMPQRVAEAFHNAGLVIVKGDLNYRRLVDDALWSDDTPFAEVTGYFPAPLLALRTLKSDPIVGLRRGMAVQLDAVDSKWRVNGKRGVIQFKP